MLIQLPMSILSFINNIDFLNTIYVYNFLIQNQLEFYELLYFLLFQDFIKDFDFQLSLHLYLL